MGCHAPPERDQRANPRHRRRRRRRVPSLASEATARGHLQLRAGRLRAERSSPLARGTGSLLRRGPRVAPAHLMKVYSPNVLESMFSDVRTIGGPNPSKLWPPRCGLVCLPGNRVMLLLGSTHQSSLHLATARDIVELVGSVFVPAFTAIELISLLPVDCGRVKKIVASPAIEDILAPASAHVHIVTIAPIEHCLPRQRVRRRLLDGAHQTALSRVAGKASLGELQIPTERSAYLRRPPRRPVAFSSPFLRTPVLRCLKSADHFGQSRGRSRWSVLPDRAALASVLPGGFSSRKGRP